jgi:signal transduction histidine kinase/ligand-binding sensor domain-containing protein
VSLALFLLSFGLAPESQADQHGVPGSDSRVPLRAQSIAERLIEGRDIAFRRLPSTAGLSQTRVAQIAQDRDGFLWFGTQYGLNRYDGYRSKVFKHEPGQPSSLSCVYIRSLFVDHSGALWVGCDRFLDRFEPVTETFVHYAVGTHASDDLPTPIERINEDRAGILWLATSKGLYKLDPATRQTTRYIHDAADPTSISGNRINSAGEDRSGRFWVASNGGLDEFERKTGRVMWHLPFQAEVSRFHEDKFGVFWMIASFSPSCALATFDFNANIFTCHSIDYKLQGLNSPINISGILESSDSTIWLSSSLGLLKLDRQRKQITRYHNDPSDDESLESDNIISVYQDKEDNIWTSFQEAEPNFFAERPSAFENFTNKRGSLVNPLVTGIYEDHNGILWIASMGGLNRIDRRTGTNTVPAGSGVGNEILAILEDPSGVLFSGMFHHGLQRLDPATGTLSPYVHSREPSNVSQNPIMRIIFDHQGTLWAATYGGISRLDRVTGNFVTYTPEMQNTIQYQVIKEDSSGALWLGAQSGLHRFDRQTREFTIYKHDPDDPRSLSDNRVNSVQFDRAGNMWIGTQNGLDEFESRTGTFKAYYQQDGLAGDVVSCILEDRHGLLWMSTNNGLSSFNPQSQVFQNFSVADGLPGPDLTGWGACYESPSGEMFFGGFNGATGFYPDRIVNSSFVPRTILTDFRLSGNPVPIGSGSPLKESITYTQGIRLTHQQNIFSIEFSALSYFNPATNRYRYKLEGLRQEWVEVNSEHRTASYTTLPTGDYTFRVQGATSRGAWSEPGSMLRIRILPPWWGTWWFRTATALTACGLLWMLYRLRLRQMTAKMDIRYAERLAERTRIARELHDTLLQSFQGLVLRFQGARNLLPARTGEGLKMLDAALEQAEEAITEGREAIHNMRSSTLVRNDLSEALRAVGNELAAGDTSQFRLVVEGSPRDVHAVVRDEVYLIAREAIHNAFCHAKAKVIEAEITYTASLLRLCVRDDGKGIDEPIARDARPDHYGLPGMRERAARVGGALNIWSRPGTGTEIELKIPGSKAYGTSGERWLPLFRRRGNSKKAGSTNGRGK